jgi:hypothetical protein
MQQSGDLVQRQVDSIISQIDQNSFYAQSQEFRNTLYKFLKLGENSLNVNEKETIKKAKAAGMIPDGRITSEDLTVLWNRLEAAESQTERESLLAEYQKKFDTYKGQGWKGAIRSVVNEVAEPLDQGLEAVFDTYGHAQYVYDKARELIPGLPEVDFTVGMVGPMQEEFEELGLGTLEPGDDIEYYEWEAVDSPEEPGKKKIVRTKKTRKATDGDMWLQNLVSNIVTLPFMVPAQAIENLWEFSKGIVTMPTQELQNIGGAIFHNIVLEGKDNWVKDIPPHDWRRTAIETIVSEDPENALARIRETGGAGPIFGFLIGRAAVRSGIAFKRSRALKKAQGKPEPKHPTTDEGLDLNKTYEDLDKLKIEEEVPVEPVERGVVKLPKDIEIRPRAAVEAELKGLKKEIQEVKPGSAKYKSLAEKRFRGSPQYDQNLFLYHRGTGKVREG